MSADPHTARPRYLASTQREDAPAAALVWNHGRPGEQRYVFQDQIQIGRDEGLADPLPGMLLIADATISRRHCVVWRSPDGRCFARDLSRNGTRLDGLRMVPNVEVEVRVGQTLALGAHAEFRIDTESAVEAAPSDAGKRTVGVPGSGIATVLVGDIRNYTALVRRAEPLELHQSVDRVFALLGARVTELRGTIKEYQGDALLAFWEGNLSGTQAVAACRAALALDAAVQDIAADRSVWTLAGFDLQMDWALATGLVLLDSMGGERPTGLSLIGEPVVLAFRLEKFANDATGRILACRVTRTMAAVNFRFRDLGKMQAKGFDQPDDVFALERECEPPDGNTT